MYKFQLFDRIGLLENPLQFHFIIVTLIRLKYFPQILISILSLQQQHCKVFTTFKNPCIHPCGIRTHDLLVLNNASPLDQISVPVQRAQRLECHGFKSHNVGYFPPYIHYVTTLWMEKVLHVKVVFYINESRYPGIVYNFQYIRTIQHRSNPPVVFTQFLGLCLLNASFFSF
jgi:hypothetical protein